MLFPDQAINLIRAMEDIQLEIVDANLSESHEQAETFAKIPDLNECLDNKVKDREGADLIQDGPRKEWMATQQEVENMEDELQITKHLSAKLERSLNKWKSEPEAT